MNALKAEILVGDIGGTKTNLAVFSFKSGHYVSLSEASFQSRQYSSLEELALDFLSQHQLDVTAASFCVAGPVTDGRARVTNLPWVVDKTKLSEALGGIKVCLFNDLLAFAHGALLLKPEETFTINKGQARQNGALLVMAPGTGLGQSYLVWNGTRYEAYPSEGGHGDFAPTNALEMELLQYLSKRFDHVSYERVCSGMGLPNIYHFLKESGLVPEPDWLAEKMAHSDDPAAVISTAALDDRRPSRLCRKTMEMFTSILGAAAGNAALHMMAVGGVYLGGGIPPRILPFLNRDLFMQAFVRKGRFSDLMAQIPVHVILNPKIALMGAARLIME